MPEGFSRGRGLQLGERENAGVGHTGTLGEERKASRINETKSRGTEV